MMLRWGSGGLHGKAWWWGFEMEGFSGGGV